jgi:hypothetical protein
MQSLNTLGRAAAITARTAFSWRGVAFVAGVILLSGTLAILFYDVVALGAQFTLKHYQTLVIVAGTLLVGILAEQAWHRRQFGSLAGFSVLFLVGTGLVIYSSVGRQGEKTMMSAGEHDLAVGKRLDLERKIASETAAFAAKRSDADAVCKKLGPDHRRCLGARAVQSVYADSLAGVEARLAQLAPPTPVDPAAEQFATSAAAFGYDKGKVAAGAGLAFPYMLTLFFEFGTIWCFARAFGPNRQRRHLPTPAETAQTSFEAGPSVDRRWFGPDDRNGPTPKPDRPAPGGRLSKTETLQHVLFELALGRTFPSQDTLVGLSGRPKQTVSDWCRDWERQRLIPARTQAGRCKVLAAAS